MKKTYEAPSAELTRFDTEEILGISFTGSGSILDPTEADKYPSADFGKVPLF